MFRVFSTALPGLGDPVLTCTAYRYLIRILVWSSRRPSSVYSCDPSSELHTVQIQTALFLAVNADLSLLTASRRLLASKIGPGVPFIALNSQVNHVLPPGAAMAANLMA